MRQFVFIVVTIAIVLLSVLIIAKSANRHRQVELDIASLLRGYHTVFESNGYIQAGLRLPDRFNDFGPLVGVIASTNYAWAQYQEHFAGVRVTSIYLLSRSNVTERKWSMRLSKQYEVPRVGWRHLLTTELEVFNK